MNVDSTLGQEEHSKYKDFLQHVALYEGVSLWFDLFEEGELGWMPSCDQLCYAQEILSWFEPLEALDCAD